MFRSQKQLRRAGLACVTLLAGACDTSGGYERIPAPDVAKFELEAYPVLLRDCGFPACHGAKGRFFRVYGPGRSRMRADMSAFAPATPEELEESYGRARSMLAHEKSVFDSWLLRKPLAEAAGGADHGGNDRWGRNVYQTVDAPGYAAIRAWAVSQQKQPSPDASTGP